MAHLVSLESLSDSSYRHRHMYSYKRLIRPYNGYNIYYIGDWDDPFEYQKVVDLLTGSYTNKVVALEESFFPYRNNPNGFIETTTDFIQTQFDELTNNKIDINNKINNIFVIVRNKDRNKSLYFLLEKQPISATSATSATSAFYKKKSMKKKSMKKKSLKQKKSMKKKNKKF